MELEERPYHCLICSGWFYLIDTNPPQSARIECPSCGNSRALALIACLGASRVGRGI